MQEGMAIHFNAPETPSSRFVNFIPLMPIGTVEERGFFYPRKVRDVNTTQNLLDESVENELGRRAERGTVSQVLWWDGIFCTLGAFDPRTGLQVGLGQALWDPDPRGRERVNLLMGYKTAFIVARKYERLGLGSIMRIHLENYMARNISGLGAYFLSHIQATSQRSRYAAIAIMEKVGAIPAKDPSMKGWYLKLVLGSEVPETPKVLTIQQLALHKRTEAVRSPDKVSYRAKGFYVDDTKIAEMKRGMLTFTGSSEHMRQMFELWRNAKRSGFSIGLSL